MNRKDFLKKSLTSIGVISLVPFMTGCAKKDIIISDTTVSGGNADCLVSPNETVGPFPTRNPSTLVMQDITADRQGILMSIELFITNNDNCVPIKNASVDIWYCDAVGNYSEYSFNSSLHFLRGRQKTNNEGFVRFKGIFPGWWYEVIQNF